MRYLLLIFVFLLLLTDVRYSYAAFPATQQVVVAAPVAGVAVQPVAPVANADTMRKPVKPTDAKALALLKAEKQGLYYGIAGVALAVAAILLMWVSVIAGIAGAVLALVAGITALQSGSKAKKLSPDGKGGVVGTLLGGIAILGVGAAILLVLMASSGLY